MFICKIKLRRFHIKVMVKIIYQGKVSGGSHYDLHCFCTLKFLKLLGAGRVGVKCLTSDGFFRSFL